MFRKTSKPTPSTLPPVPVARRSTAAPAGERQLRAALRDLAAEGGRPSDDDHVSVIDLREAVEEAIESLRR